MSRQVCGLVLVALVALAVRVRAELPAVEFQEVVSQEGRFSIYMPGEPQQKTENIGSDGEELPYTQWLTPVGDDAVFICGYFDVDRNIAAANDPQKLMQAFRSGARGEAEILEDRALALGKTKIPGRDYQVAVAPYHVRERMFLHGNRFYRIIAVGAKEDVLSRTANQFFASFQVAN